MQRIQWEKFSLVRATTTKSIVNHAPKLFAAFPGVTTAIVFALALCSTAFAQITITNASFPVAGDTLKMAIDNFPAGIVPYTPPGGNQTWNFSGLQVDATRNIVYRPASQGSVQVPGAELFAVTSPNWEEYYNVTSNRFELQADYGIYYDVIGNSLFNYIPTMEERRAPLNFFDINQIWSETIKTLPPSAFPPALIAALPVTVDSLRYRITIIRLDVVDGWGTVSIPGGTYNVLREKRTWQRENRLDAKVPPLGWLDITDVAIQAGFRGLGIDTLITYNFWNNVEKEPIAIVALDNAQNLVTKVMFKNNSPPTTVQEQTPHEFALLQNYPNPFNPTTTIRYAIPGGTHGRASLRVYDLLGREVATLVNEVKAPGSHQVTWDATGLASGIYLYRLRAGGFAQTRKILLAK
ncbi:MAG: T9SS type A sorting domain-containing protein [Bacteroidetes bacterium]|nr:T9SS type A sorting domain-containing protein [Bacteroidota bacterium]MCW5894416.1 T9SS type A sorting domain-containing protein [Bacteroidota bacterium]